MKNWMVLLFSIFLALPSGVIVADQDRGWSAYNAEDYVSAYTEWLPLAEQGATELQYMLGYMHLIGEGVLRDYEQSRQWFLKAANSGYPAAHFAFGDLV